MRGRFNNKGSFLGLIAILGAITAALTLMISRMSESSARQMTYLSIMKKVHSNAETGLNRAVSKLVYNGGACDDGTFSNPFDVATGLEADPDDLGPESYRISCSRRDAPLPNVFYVVTESSVIVSGREYAQKLHSYVSISNVSEYFAAINGPLLISKGTDISQGKVYAEELTFALGVGGPTRVGRAEYASSVTPSNWTNAIKSQIQIAEPSSTNAPVKLAAPLLFPQITSSDLDMYKTLAGVHTSTNEFRGEIYPPGFAGYDPSFHDPNDDYDDHTTNNAQHVYYWNGDIHIYGPATVHGQVLFVATGKIIIHGDLRVSTIQSELDVMKGVVNASSSTAHQAILIPGPGKDVEIAADFHTGALAQEIQVIEALIFAPSGGLIAHPYVNAGVHSYLNLDFTGSMILGESPELALVFSGAAFSNSGRRYQYMSSLRTEPPPYLPALSVIHYQFQEITSEYNAHSLPSTDVQNVTLPH